MTQVPVEATGQTEAAFGLSPEAAYWALVGMKDGVYSEGERRTTVTPTSQRLLDFITPYLLDAPANGEAGKLPTATDLEAERLVIEESNLHIVMDAVRIYRNHTALPSAYNSRLVLKKNVEGYDPIHEAGKLVAQARIAELERVDDFIEAYNKTVPVIPIVIVGSKS